jgi:spore coat polysaccharide biosynthesis predicted glycosyltransferase SpsG/RimJ/RimL family protein N-acetyltransferase
MYQAFVEFGIQPQLIINGDKTAKDLTKDMNRRIFNWLSDRKTLFAITKDADVVLIDSYLANRDFYKKISETTKISAYFDDNIRLNYPKGFVINGAIFAEQMPYPKRKGVIYLIGAQYAPLRKEFWDVPTKPVRDVLKSIIITFGGADIRNLMPKVLKLLVDTHPKLCKKVIIGRGFQNKSEIESLKDRNTELIYYPDAADMKKIMLESDIAITAGGQTVYELARTGIATIAVAVAENQLGNIRRLESVGFVEYAGRYEDGGLEGVIKHKIELLKDKNIRQHKCIVGKTLIDGTGSNRIVKELLSEFYRCRLTLRKAISADARDLFDLANEDAVRKNSFSPDKIEWDHHLQWLRKKLRDGDCLLFIVTCSGKFVGQVRFDITPEQKQSIISISLGKNVRGLGLSPFIISKSIKKLLKTRNDVKLIKAYIKNNNTPSVKSFERAGFRFLEHRRVGGFKSKVYERVIKNENE